MMYIFHILINSADTDEMPLIGSSLFAKVPVYYFCLPVTRQLKFTKVIQAYIYDCILHIKCFNRADKCMFIGSNLVGSQPFHTWNTPIQRDKCIFSAFTCFTTIETIYLTPILKLY